MKAYITVKKISNRGIKSKPWYVILYDDLNQTTPKLSSITKDLKPKKMRSMKWKDKLIVCQI